MSFRNQSLGEIAASIPGATRLFREYDLDFCCGGTAILADAAAAKGLNLDEIISRLTELQNSRPSFEGQDWRVASYADTIEHILARYHQRHREQLQELILLGEKVEQVHGARPDAPLGVTAELKNIYASLDSHMMKEEQILFPMINAGSYATARMPIHVMMMEHDEEREHIEKLKSLTNNLTLPADACSSWTALYRGIGEFIDDLMHHIHTENNILFPRVLAESA
ncbi:iron-sulfur cluster repair protein YtfE [Pasteurellaceae bacterium LIM206]|nr:iron-sulfur cluster repair protein YtfE [Pasteurellaceae bacterium LIM206]